MRGETRARSRTKVPTRDEGRGRGEWPGGDCGARKEGGRTRLTSSALDSTDGSGSSSRSRAHSDGAMARHRARAQVPRREIRRR